MQRQANSPDQWIDYLTALGYDVNEIYHSIIKRIKGQPKKLMADILLKIRNLLQKQPNVKNFLLSQPPYEKIQAIIHQLENGFKLPPPQMEMLLNKYLWHNYSLDQLFDYLQSKGMKVKVKFHRGEYQILVFITPGMEQQYRIYGDVINVSFHFVPLKRNSLLRTCYLGLFSGISNLGQPVIVGYSLVVGSTPQFRGQAILAWLQLIQPRSKMVLIGEYNIFVSKNIEEYNRKNGKKVYFLENWHYTIEKGEKMLITEPSKKQLVSTIKKLLLTFNQRQRMELLKKTNRLLTLKENRPIIEHLLEKTMSSFYKEAPMFVGFQIQANKYNFVSELLQAEINYCPKMGLFLYNLLQLELKINNPLRKDRKPVLPMLLKKFGLVNIHPEINHIAQILSQQLFRKLIYNYYLSVKKCRIKFIDAENPTILQIQELQVTKQQSKSESYLGETQPITRKTSFEQYNLKFKIESNYWQCQCKVINWSGLPCSHLISVILHFGGSIQYYINSRWHRQENGYYKQQS